VTALTAWPDRTDFTLKSPNPTASPGPIVIATDDAQLARPSMRQALREATREVHERLHQHAGFSAVAAGDIDLPRYRQLLSRLYGFHRGMEDRLVLSAKQSAALAADLVTLGLDQDTIVRLPRCATLPRMDTDAKRLGALYVIEGAALGGRVLARSLDRLFGTEAVEGRQFFSGQGAQTGAKWQAFLAELEHCGDSDSAFTDAITSAQDMFAAFEMWLNGWEFVACE
jgi:heme oxygenase (biliverdin-IX-beta and delta-forming)